MKGARNGNTLNRVRINTVFLINLKLWKRSRIGGGGIFFTGLSEDGETAPEPLHNNTST